MQKSEKKKNFYGTFSLAVFLFPVIKRAEKESGFVFFRKWRGTMLNKLLRKENIFSPLGSFFTIFGR